MRREKFTQTAPLLCAAGGSLSSGAIPACFGRGRV